MEKYGKAILRKLSDFYSCPVTCLLYNNLHNVVIPIQYKDEGAQTTCYIHDQLNITTRLYR